MSSSKDFYSSKTGLPNRAHAEEIYRRVNCINFGIAILQYQVLQILCKNFPKDTLWDEIEDELYDQYTPKPATCRGTRVNELRKRLEPHGIEIETISNKRAYRMRLVTNDN